MNKYNKLIQLLKNKKFIYIQTHNFPDPDAIASAFTLQYFLKQFNIKSKIIYHGTIANKTILYMIKKLKIRLYPLKKINIKPADKIIVVDTQIDNSNIKKLNAEYIAFIDHHENNTRDYPEFYDLQPQLGACVTIIGNYLSKLPIKSIAKNIATAILIGLFIDTNRLTRKTSFADIKILHDYFNYADIKLVNYITLNSIGLNDLKYFNQGIKHIHVYKDIGIIQLKKIYSQQLLAIISDFFLNLREIELVIGYYITKTEIHIAIRSEAKYYNAAKLMYKLVENLGTGGGHKTMAGGIIDTTNINNKFNLQQHILKTLRSMDY